MGIVSYAQNFEDVMLWRVLADATPGFYIDIGAQHPLVDSVSRAFYDQGWRGIHVEPTPEHAALIVKSPADRVDQRVLGPDVDVKTRRGVGQHAPEHDVFEVLRVCCLLYTSPSPRDGATSRMPSSA